MESEYDEFIAESEYYVIVKTNDGKKSIIRDFWEFPPNHRQILVAAICRNDIVPSDIKSFEVCSVTEDLGLFAGKDETPFDARSRIMAQPIKITMIPKGRLKDLGFT